MKYLLCGLLTAVIALSAADLTAKEISGYIAEAEKLYNEGQAKEAIALLEQGVAEHPESSDLYAYLGLYTGMSAGQATEYMEAGRLAMLSFQHLDKAVALDDKNPRAFLYRGLMGVKVPPFLGKLEAGILDLKRVLAMREKAPGTVDEETAATALTLLAEGYEKNGDIEGARGTLETIIASAPGTPAAESAQARLEALPATSESKADPLAATKDDDADIAALKKRIEAAPNDAGLIFELGMAYYEAEQFAPAREVLKKLIALDPGNAEAYKMLGISTARTAEGGYDERIAENTDLRSGLAFESIGYLDEAVRLNPNDTELRLVRGTFGVMFPFFVGKHDQGVEDLEFVVNNTVSQEEKAQALFYLGYAKRREATRYWIDVAKQYPKSDAADLVFEQMRPSVKRFDPDAYDRPVVAVDFVLGFQDELPPQTAVWVEDMDEHHVATIYVSGFAGNVKGKQVTLPVWAAVSNFEGCDAVTSASIDVGHHIYTWNCTDVGGKRVPPGTYKVKVEVSFWPSMLYQTAEAVVEIGTSGDMVTVEEGVYIPYLHVTFLPE
jgi:tetratricopeptide (TPR) repeat protein